MRYILLLLFPLFALGQGATNDYIFYQKPATGPLVPRAVTPTVGRLMGWPSSISAPASITLGTGLSLSGSTLNSTAGISDGDKGNITVSASGATWTIDAGVVTDAMLAGSISNGKLATNPLARANHTGTQDWSTISARPNVSTANGTTGGGGGVGGSGGGISTAGGSSTLATNGGNGGAINLTGADSEVAGNGGNGGSILAGANGIYNGGSIITASPGTNNGGAIDTQAGGSLTMGAGSLTGPATSGTIMLTTGSGAAITALNASNISSGSLALARIDQAGATSGQAIAWNGSAWAPATVGVSDGDKGDITVSASGATWMIDAGAVTDADLAGSITPSKITGTAAVLSANTFTGLQQFSGTTHAGLRLNNLTTTQRDALTGAAGMAVWNTTDGRLQLHNGTGWTAGMVRLDGDTMTGALTISSASSLILGTAGSAVGSIGFRNATSGIATLAPPTGALGTYTVTLPSTAGTLINGSAGTVDNTVLRADGTGGGTIQGGSLVTISDTGDIFLPGALTTSAGLIVNSATGYLNFNNDAIFRRGGAAATLQCGSNTATDGATAIAQTIKGPNATGATGTGGSLTLAGGTGPTAGGAVIITTAATTTQTERARFSSAGVTIGASGTAIASVISNTATLDFPSTGSHDASTLTITVTGAAVGDVVAIGIPNGSVGTDGVFFGWVSAADTVTIRYCNTDNGGAVDPASGTFRATVIKH